MLQTRFFSCPIPLLPNLIFECLKEVFVRRYYVENYDNTK